ncbi:MULTISPECIES: DUF1365 domain-containing protein [Pseudomonas]|uniref:DUF1365 domain-containing protein n=2 Tax=Pseudomonas TaxID=286 RepID=A0AAX0VY64_9PSED|nr:MULTISPECIES: DUF1365 domain-containing protein [Pseudomonas]MBH3358198.1 DUF1365 domain-containing protein [Pseudomonas guariconensis]MCO7622091.1 DUF1365 domain-containing protein [Pseudomonas guariconensis]MEB3841206.1 DUF1365 domain-containing protein [Pseudomonas guariconensis]MEB3874074.1 DUF1365 domain-containing protein [Pseudomonas guariconensis]MEB3877496.1 DUF1365 domain-containing protein [Pseudomonas guariconensis]
MNSGLCLGWLSHRRLSPRYHAFRYRIGMFYLDLDEQAWLMSLSRWLGSRRLSPLNWRQTDYLPALTRQGEPLAEAARLLVEQATGHRPEGPVHLLTQLRCWGLSFNPVSFYFCHDRHGHLTAILLEVRNTPWHERFHYVLPVQGRLDRPFSMAKAFHVSPFMPLDMDYRLQLSLNLKSVRIHMENWQGCQKVFEADLALQRQPLDRKALHRYLLSFPWMSLRTVSAIYWQALRLLFKRTPIHDHTASRGSLALGQPCEDPDHVESHPER